MGLIPPIYFDCVVAIGLDDSKGNRHWIASGFLYGHFLKQDEKGKHQQYHYTQQAGSRDNSVQPPVNRSKYSGHPSTPEV